MRLIYGCIAVLAAACGLGAAERTLEFNRDVRPILSDRCFTCHGPDARSKRIKLRLDLEEIAKGDLGNGRRAIVPGDTRASLLVQRITSDDDALRMPPVWSGHALTAAEKETLVRWVAEGGRWQPHWAFTAPRRPEPPAVRDAAWPRNPIDRFVLARLEREGLRPRPEADRETLIRRVALDLTGAPPTLAEIDAFVADRSTSAYEKAVDRLLASPRYGERMAARWLDAARYADSNGYQYDGERFMWRWRDWVIDAFNANKPYDRFALEQIAGDMLPGATHEQIVATGFNRNHRGMTEDGVVAEEYAVEYVVDRVETTATTFLGLTMGCARCHDHKYDPFTQREFYRLFAYFNNVPERGRAMKYGNSPPLEASPTREQEAKLRDLEHEIASVRRTLERREPDIERAQRAWERTLATDSPGSWAPARGLDAAFPLDGLVTLKEVGGKVRFEPGKREMAAVFDGSTQLETTGVAAFDIDDRFTLTAWIRPAAPDGSIVSRMAEGPRGKGFGMHLVGGKVYVHVTNEWKTDALRLETDESVPQNEWHHLAFTYDGSKLAEGIALYIDGKRANLRVQLDTLYRPFRNAGRKYTETLRIGGGMGPKYRFQGSIDDARVYARTLERDEVAALAVADPIGALAARPPERRSDAERRVLRNHFLQHAAPEGIRSLRRRLDELAWQGELLERTFPTVMVMAECAERKETRILHRGAYDRPGERVEPGVPGVFPSLPSGASNNRLGFARWLVDPANPLTARVAVNRFWQMYFGTGLVKTAEDFGLQGEWPSHPELLDWLATELVASAWDVKKLQRLIVTSATYRQSSKATAELVARDPENRLLARGPRFRLAAEMIRDQALAVSGLLKERVGGPSVKPYQPDGLWNDTSMQDMDYIQSHGDDLYRRSFYTFWKRTIAPPMLVNFDAAMREACVVRETRTNTPLQALNLMNDVTFVEAARMLGQRMMKEGGDAAESRLGHGFRLALGRRPSAEEAKVLAGSLEFHRGYFAANAERARAFLSTGETRPDATLDPVELAAYGAVGSLILNLDAVVAKE